MGMLEKLRSWLGQGDTAAPAAATKLYVEAVAQARQHALYADHHVPDTLDGRFEMLVLHVHLLCRRLARCGPIGGRVAQALFDTMFRDFDRNLREMGVSDPSLPKRIRAMVEAYYGRVGAYEAAGAEGPNALKAVFLRNVYNASGDAAAAARLAEYAVGQRTALDDAPDALVSSGEFRFRPLGAAGARP